MESPNAEAEMGLLLGQILGIPNTAALAVFQSLRRSSAQRDAIISAAKTTLNDVDLELLNALLDVHKAIEKDRNALSHGHFGTYDKTPDVILWMATVDYIEFKARWHLAKITITTNEKMSLFSRIYFYTASDLSAIYKNITYVADMWVGAIRWLQATGPLRAELYRQQCDQSHIRQALETLRRKKQSRTSDSIASTD
jgi:hypothetical protein